MYQIAKRLVDVVLSVIALIILLPLIILISLGLLFTGEHYIFYRQKRLGLNKRYFKIIKFATMVKNSPNMGSGMLTHYNDSRMLCFGKFLRRSKINEIPQVFNVLLGQMSLVGPRPLVDETFNAYPLYVQKLVYKSKPGITGIGSIAFRNEERHFKNTSLSPEKYYSDIIAPYKGELELWYLKHKSLRVDFCIIFLTIWVVFFPKSKLLFRVFKSLPRTDLIHF